MSERLNNDPEFDVIGDVLDTLRFRGSIFFRSELAAPWGMSLEPTGVPRFHVALSGNCFVGSDDNDAVRVDEMGIKFAITIDFDTFTDNKVTIRERDSMKQVRVAIDELVLTLITFLEGN